MPLQEALRVGERAVLLGVRRGREEEHLGADVLRAQLAARDLGRRAPELGRLGRCEVAHHEPVERAQALALQRPRDRADHRVLAEHEIAGELAVGHVRDRREVRVVARQTR